ncbi:hypothetical protein Tco_0979095 [Tanacetum coccineum]
MRPFSLLIGFRNPLDFHLLIVIGTRFCLLIMDQFKPVSNLAQEEGPRESFDELMDTLLDFSSFMMNRLKVDTLTPKLLAATTDQLDWNNLEGQQYPHDLRKPLPLIPNSRGRQVIPFDHFINNDLAYLSGGVSSRTYATSVMKTKAADYVS